MRAMTMSLVWRDSFQDHDRSLASLILTGGKGTCECVSKLTPPAPEAHHFMA